MRIKDEREQQRAVQAELVRASMTQDEQDEEHLRQQRDLDDWKDEHPAGYGNSKLRPCAL